MFFGKLTDFGCFPVDAILSNISVVVNAMPNPLNI